MTCDSIVEREGEYDEYYQCVGVLLDVISECSCKRRVCVCLADKSVLALSSSFEYIYTNAVVLVGAINGTVTLARVL